MKKKFYTLIAVSLLLSLTVKAQNETRFWYFGTNAGLDFVTSPPTVLTNGAVSAGEGTAVMTDPSGNLLFYTNGATVYNQNHTVMSNGTGLMGDISTTHSAIIIKKPASPDLYYLFTLDDSGSQGFNGLNYSIVDMSLAAGMGSVTVKNATLCSSSTEKMAAVMHCNGTDVWVISHDLTTNVFRTYLVTASGLNGTPVLSATGNVLETIGQMKVSPSGRQLAVAGFGPTGGYVLYDFDPATGTVSNPLALASSFYAYGCEFSPDGSKLYGTDHVSEEIHQWDLCAGAGPAIVASKYTVTAPGAGNYFGAMQAAADGKIYITLKYQQVLSVINNPNVSGAGCNYQHMSQSIAPKANGMGLPTFITRPLKPVTPAFTYTIACQSVSFTAGSVSPAVCGAASSPLTGTQWEFGDPASGGNNFFSGTTPVHQFSGPGTYSVKCISVYQCSSDTILIPITVSGTAPSMSISGVFTICRDDVRTFTVSGANAYLWNNNATTATISLSPTVTTVYTVTGTNTSNGCTANKTMTVTVNICTEITEHGNKKDHVLVYPNPFSESLTIHSETGITLSISDQVGSVLIERELGPGEHAVDTGRFPAGFYVISILKEGTRRNLRFVKTSR